MTELTTLRIWKEFVGWYCQHKELDQPLSITDEILNQESDWFLLGAFESQLGWYLKFLSKCGIDVCHNRIYHSFEEQWTHKYTMMLNNGSSYERVEHVYNTDLITGYREAIIQAFKLANENLK